MAIRTEETTMTAVEAEKIFNAANKLHPGLMRGVAIALRQGRGIAWLKQQDEQVLFSLGILILDEKANLQVREELIPHFCPLRRCQEGEEPVSGTRSIYTNEDDVPPEQILNFRRQVLNGITPRVVKGVRQ